MADQSEQPTQIFSGPPSPPSGGTATLEPHAPALADGGGSGSTPPRPPVGYGGDGSGDGTGDDGSGGGNDKRLAFIAAFAGILLVIVLFLVLKPGSKDDTTTTTPQPTTQPAPASTPAPAASTPVASTPATSPQASTPPSGGGNSGNSSGGNSGGSGDSGGASINSDLPQLGGKGVVKFEAAQGDTVSFQVTNSAETSQEVHVHGYDKAYDLQPGETRTISFPATITGIFEIEFEATATQIGELTVNP